MRIDARRLDAFLADPGACRVALLFGDDAGLIRSRADRLIQAVAGRVDDPFRVVELAREVIAGLPDEAASLALTGGRRAVRVRDVGENALAAVDKVLAGPGDALVVLEGFGLPARSKLRQRLEAAADGAAIGCYPAEGRDLEQAIRDRVAALGASIDRDALRWVSQRLGGGYGQVVQEAEKLALFAGRGGSIDLAAAMDCLGDGASLSLDDALFAATEGNVAACDRAIGLVLEDGPAAPAAIRAAIGHLQRVLRVREAIETGMSVEQAIAGLRPPVFWRRQPALKRALSLWSCDVLARALNTLDGAERRCRETAAPASVICRSAFAAVALQAAAAATSERLRS